MATKKKTKRTNRTNRRPHIICGGATGRAVIFGWLDAEPVAGQPVVIHDARMILYWSAECGGLLGLASKGPQTTTRITSAVARVTDTCRQSLTIDDPAVAEKFATWPAA